MLSLATGRWTGHPFNPLNPPDALNHHFASVKNDLISRDPLVLEQIIFKELFLKITYIFHLSPTSSHLPPLQIENCESNSRLVVDEDDNGKFRLERVK